MKKSLSILMLFVVMLFSFQLITAVCMANGQEVPCEPFPWTIFIIVAIIGLAFFIFWVIMLIDAIRHEEESKALWIILIIILSVLGAIIYYFARKRKRAKQLAGQESTQNTMQMQQNRTVPVNANPRLVEYIRTATSQGFTLDQIKNKLVLGGWSEVDVNAAINSC